MTRKCGCTRGRPIPATSDVQLWTPRTGCWPRSSSVSPSVSHGHAHVSSSRRHLLAHRTPPTHLPKPVCTPPQLPLCSPPRRPRPPCARPGSQEAPVWREDESHRPDPLASPFPRLCVSHVCPSVHLSLLLAPQDKHVGGQARVPMAPPRRLVAPPPPALATPTRLPIGPRGGLGRAPRPPAARWQSRGRAGRQERAASGARGHARPPVAGPGVAAAGAGARRRGDPRRSAESAQLPAPGGRRALAAPLLLHPLLPGCGPQRPRAGHPLAPQP